MSNGDIKGTGYHFTHTVTDGLRAGGLWLVMQDDAGQIAGNSGDIIMYAVIEDVDWLSGSQIKLKLAVQHWESHSCRHATTTSRGQVYPLWQDSYLPVDDILVMRLFQCTNEYLNNDLCRSNTPTVEHLNTNWICWRWLEFFLFLWTRSSACSNTHFRAMY